MNERNCNKKQPIDLLKNFLIANQSKIKKRVQPRKADKDRMNRTKGVDLLKEFLIKNYKSRTKNI